METSINYFLAGVWHVIEDKEGMIKIKQQEDSHRLKPAASLLQDRNKLGVHMRAGKVGS